jgi:hypothetical protein
MTGDECCPTPVLYLLALKEFKIMQTARVKRSVMLRKALIGVTIFAGTTVAAVGQEEPTNQTSKPTLEDVQHLAEMVSSDKSKLSAYCELGQLLDETRQAVEYNDTNAIAAVTAKTNAFERQLGPEYDKVFNGLDQIDFSSDEGKQIAATFYTLQQKCEEQKEE